jgi:hypothetical protein
MAHALGGHGNAGGVLLPAIVLGAKAVVHAQVGEDDRPMQPPTVTGADVLWNPFEDIVPRTTREDRDAAAAEARCGHSG